MMSIMTKQLNLFSIRPEDISPKTKIFVSMCNWKLSSIFFMTVLEQCFLPCWAVLQVMLIWYWFFCEYRYFSTCFLQHPLFWDWCALFESKYIHLKETEYVCFLSGMTNFLRFCSSFHINVNDFSTEIFS